MCWYQKLKKKTNFDVFLQQMSKVFFSFSVTTNKSNSKDFFFSFGLDHSIIVLNFYTYTAYLINLNLMGQKNPEDHPSLNSTKGRTHPP
jgi:membrane-associated phospholipid phosphatase